MSRVLAVLVMLLGLSSAAQAMSLQSPTIRNGKTLPMAHVFNMEGCGGSNQSPELSWDNVPPQTRGFAVIVDDPDARFGWGWLHWLVYNLPAATRTLAAGAGAPDGKNLPVGAIQTLNDFEIYGYGGACPPAGASPHHYRFTVFALDVETLDLLPEASLKEIRLAIKRHTLAQATLTATFGH